MGKVLETLLFEKENGIKGRLYHYSQVHLAYNSNHIEGSRLTEDQTRLIFETASFVPDEGKQINTDDIVETVNHFSLFDYMLDTIEQPLSETLIKEFHRLLKQGTSDARKNWFRVGDYKALANEVGGITTSAPQNVSKDMQNLLVSYPKTPTFEDIAAFHYCFERIHPFQDGNGRVGRLILFRECLRQDLLPIIVEEAYKAYYYRGLQMFASEPGYLLDTFRSMQDIYSQKMVRLGI